MRKKFAKVFFVAGLLFVVGGVVNAMETNDPDWSDLCWTHGVDGARIFRFFQAAVNGDLFAENLTRVLDAFYRGEDPGEGDFASALPKGEKISPRKLASSISECSPGVASSEETLQLYSDSSYMHPGIVPSGLILELSTAKFLAEKLIAAGVLDSLVIDALGRAVGIVVERANEHLKWWSDRNDEKPIMNFDRILCRSEWLISSKGLDGFLSELEK